MMKEVHVLWTGGWDSTFRVLQVVATTERRVQPHYIINPERESTDLELAAMEGIRTIANERWSDRIDPPVITQRELIPVSNKTQAHYESLLEEFYLGPQYVWLSEYAQRLGAGLGLELCVHSDDRASIVQAIAGTGARKASDAQSLLTDWFRFPILHFSKLRMADFSAEQGFADLMERTWFCQEPTKDGLACGFCRPCRSTIEEGLSQRISRARRIRATTYRMLSRWTPSYRVRKMLLHLLSRG